MRLHCPLWLTVIVNDVDGGAIQPHIDPFLCRWLYDKVKVLSPLCSHIVVDDDSRKARLVILWVYPDQSERYRAIVCRGKIMFVLFNATLDVPVH